MTLRVDQLARAMAGMPRQASTLVVRADALRVRVAAALGGDGVTEAGGLLVPLLTSP